jgi:hypothetical protein
LKVRRELKRGVGESPRIVGVESIVEIWLQLIGDLCDTGCQLFDTISQLLRWSLTAQKAAGAGRRNDLNEEFRCASHYRLYLLGIVLAFHLAWAFATSAESAISIKWEQDHQAG